jgi:uncharacterized membrane protein (DUF373 family)
MSKKHEEFSTDHPDPIIRVLHGIIRMSVRVLAILMLAVILWGIADVVLVIFAALKEPPHLLLTVSDIFTAFNAILVVLIAIEIFLNITLYLRDDVIHVNLVVATALMAIARKVIVFDFKVLEPQYIWATGGVLLALGITYWLLLRENRDGLSQADP